MPLYIKHNDEWKSLPRPYVKHGGAWKQTEQVYVKHDGEWKKIFPEGFVYFFGFNHNGQRTLRKLNPDTGNVVNHSTFSGWSESSAFNFHPTEKWFFHSFNAYFGPISFTNPENLNNYCSSNTQKYISYEIYQSPSISLRGGILHPTNPWIFLWYYGHSSTIGNQGTILKFDYTNIWSYSNISYTEDFNTWTLLGQHYYPVTSLIQNVLYWMNGSLYAGRAGAGIRRINPDNMSTQAEIPFDPAIEVPPNPWENNSTGSPILSFADDGTNLYLAAHRHGIMKVNPETLAFIDGYECNWAHAVTYGNGYIYAGIESPFNHSSYESKIIKINASNMTLVDEIDTIGTITDLAYDTETDSIYSTSYAGTVHKINCSNMSIAWTHDTLLSRAYQIRYQVGYPEIGPYCP